MNLDSRIFVAGHRGLVGSAIVRVLQAQGFKNILMKSRKELDLEKQAEVAAFFESEKPEYVFLAAAKVGGIYANNTYPADFVYSNLVIQNNVIHQSYLSKVKKLCFLGSSCIYPKFAPQPIKEEYLLDGKLEPTNEPYAIAKISGIIMAQSYNRQFGTDFISVMPTNLYGVNDNFDLQNAHVLPALIRKFIEAREEKKPNVTVWGTGSPRREFLYVDDMAEACVFLMKGYSGNQFINIGTGEDISIKEVAELIKEITGYQGELVFDTTKPDGTPRKLLDVGKLKSLGWSPKVSLRDGISRTVKWYEETVLKKA
ncbi:MAG: GDP-L-fucose synthase [Chloroherpetonaceae bacterium]|nr:GDP-L-fucose synthase [Chloroherpetonaceae bacterium]